MQHDNSENLGTRVQRLENDMFGDPNDRNDLGVKGDMKIIKESLGDVMRWLKATAGIVLIGVLTAILNLVLSKPHV